MPSCAITGLGAVSCFGVGTRALLSAMLEGRDGLCHIDRFSTSGFGVSRAALVPRPTSSASDAADLPPLRLLERYALTAAREAQADARLTGAYRPERAALVLGTSPADTTALVHELSEKVGDALNLRGPRLTVSTACASSTAAIGLGAELLATSAADVVVAGGADVITPLLFAGFHVLGVLSTEHCAPFSHPTGTVLGEGAGFVVLEREPAARERDVRARARLLGYGLSCDAFHETSPDPTGSGVARALSEALRSAGLEAGQVDYVSAHGTGTLANDPAEWRGLSRVLGDHAVTTPISSSKSFLGHAQAAAGVLELLATLLCLGEGLVPHTLHHRGARPLSPPDVVARSSPRAATVRYFLKASSAFAGANAAIAVASPSTPTPSITTSELRPVWLGATAYVGVDAPSGDDTALVSSDTENPRPRWTKDELLRQMPDIDAAGNDRSTLLLLVTVRRLLGEAGLLRRAPGGDRMGLVLGITRLSPESLAEVEESIRLRGLARLAPTGFSRMVLSAPAGACARAFKLKGPMSTLSTGEGSGLVALASAARLVETGQADSMLGLGVDEAPASRECDEAEGAAGALLTGASPTTTEARLRWAGSGTSGPGGGDSAIRQALAASGVDWESIDLVVSDRPEHFGRSLRTAAAGRRSRAPSASTAAFGVVLAARALSSGAARRVLVESTRGNSASIAAILMKETP